MDIEYQKPNKSYLTKTNAVLFVGFVLPILSFHFMRYWWANVEAYHRGYPLVVAAAVGCSIVSVGSLVAFYILNKNKGGA